MNALFHISPEEWELIESWLDQTEVPDEGPLLDEQLAQISNVSEKIAHIKKVREEIEDSIRQSKIKEFHNHISADEEPSDTKTIANKRIKPNTYWYAAAAVLIVFFGFFWMIDRSKTSEKIFANNFKPDIGLPLRMNTASANGFYEGMLDYKQEKYEEAITKWQFLLKDNPQSDTLNYFLGVANLALGDAAKALEYIENQDRFHQGIFKEDAAYYAALAKIKEGKFREAKAFLKLYPSNRNTQLMNELNER